MVFGFSIKLSEKINDSVIFPPREKRLKIDYFVGQIWVVLLKKHYENSIEIFLENRKIAETIIYIWVGRNFLNYVLSSLIEECQVQIVLES